MRKRPGKCRARRGQNVLIQRARRLGVEFGKLRAVVGLRAGGKIRVAGGIVAEFDVLPEHVAAARRGRLPGQVARIVGKRVVRTPRNPGIFETAVQNVFAIFHTVACAVELIAVQIVSGAGIGLDAEHVPAVRVLFLRDTARVDGDVNAAVVLHRRVVDFAGRGIYPGGTIVVVIDVEIHARPFVAHVRDAVMVLVVILGNERAVVGDVIDDAKAVFLLRDEKPYRDRAGLDRRIRRRPPAAAVIVIIRQDDIDLAGAQRVDQ